MEDDTTFAALAEVLKPMNTTKDIADRCGIKGAPWRTGVVRESVRSS